MNDEEIRSLDGALSLARELAAELVIKCGCPDHQNQVDMLDIERRTLKSNPKVLKVIWADDAIERALKRLIDLRDNANARSLFGQEMALLVAIDCLRAVLEVES